MREVGDSTRPHRGTRKGRCNTWDPSTMNAHCSKEVLSGLCAKAINLGRRSLGRQQSVIDDGGDLRVKHSKGCR